MRYSVYQKKKGKRTVYRGRQAFQVEHKKQVYDAFSVLSSLQTYTLTGFLFNLDQSNICRDIQKVEPLIRNCLPIPQKIYDITKRLKTSDEVERYFPGFLSFIDSTEQQIPRPIYKRRNIILERKRSML